MFSSGASSGVRVGGVAAIFTISDVIAGEVWKCGGGG